MIEQTEVKSKKRRINPALVMVVLFGLPYAISWYMFYSGDTLFFKEGQSEGTLISPVRLIPEFGALDLAGEKVDSQILKGKWSFMVVGPSQCEVLCKETIEMIRQVRLAQAVDRKRVQRLWLLKDNFHNNELKSLVETEHRGLRVLTHSDKLSQTLYPVLSQKSALPPYEALIEDFSIFLIDPLGNLMMYYEPATGGKKVLKDLERLLKYSELGE